MSTLRFAVPPGTPDTTGKTARMQRRLDIDPEIAAAATAAFSADVVTVTFSPAATEREAYITSVIFGAVFLGVRQGVDATFNNAVADPRAFAGVAATPSATLDAAAGCNTGSAIFDPAGLSWACLRPDTGEAVWTAGATVAEPTFVEVPTDFAANVPGRLGLSLQPAQYTAGLTATLGPDTSTQRNAVVNAERTQLLTEEEQQVKIVSLAELTSAPPVVGGTGNNPATIDRFRFKFLNSAFFLMRRGVSLLILYRLTATSIVNVQNYSTGIGTFNRCLSVTFDRRFVVVGDQLGGAAFYSVQVLGLTSFGGSPSLVNASGPFTAQAGNMSCLECTEGPPSIVFVGYLSGAGSLFRVQLDEATGAVLGGTLASVSTYDGGPVYSMKTTPSGYLLVLSATDLHVIRYGNTGATVFATQAVKAAHGLTMVYSNTNDGNVVTNTINTDAIAMSDDCRQIVAVSNVTGELAVFAFDPAADTLALVPQTSLPAAVTGAPHQTVHYLKDCAGLVLVSRPNTVSVVY